jgi:hypothetical protein
MVRLVNPIFFFPRNYSFISVYYWLAARKTFIGIKQLNRIRVFLYQFSTILLKPT